MSASKTSRDRFASFSGAARRRERTAATAAAAAAGVRSVSVIVPTYKEAENLPQLIRRIDAVRTAHRLRLELLIMDDDSRDGTDRFVEALGLPWVRLVTRKSNRGLSPAVCDGLRLARHDVLVVMDADLSHPPEKIPEMLAALADGADFVIGSRYVNGGTTDAEWGAFRWLNSKVATWLARPLTSAADPMSGFFAMHRRTLRRGQAKLNPIGYKIGLELLVKCGCKDVREIPIHFADRTVGESKLSFREQIRYLKHLRRLFMYRFGTQSQFAQFAAVGSSGMVVNLAVLTLLTWMDLPMSGAVAASIGVALVWNFWLNRRFTFPDARRPGVLGQFARFAGACSIGAVANYFTTIGALEMVPDLWPQAAATVGIAAGMMFNFVLSRTVVFAAPTVPRRDPGEDIAQPLPPARADRGMTAEILHA